MPYIVAAITTAPRKRVYLLRADQSLAAAGFKDLPIFADSPPNMILNELLPFRQPRVHFTDQMSRIGPYANWRRALVWLGEEYPDAEGYLIFQDDITAAKNLREWLDWPDGPQAIGVGSLFCPFPPAPVPGGWGKLDLQGQKGFARRGGHQGMGRVDSAGHAARLRLRPILMTSFAFILGVLPLVLATGAGAEMRQVLGTAVFFGMLGVTFFGLVFTPVFYVMFRWFGDLFQGNSVARQRRVAADPGTGPGSE